MNKINRFVLGILLIIGLATLVYSQADYLPEWGDDIALEDTGNYYTTDDVESALQEIGAGGGVTPVTGVTGTAPVASSGGTTPAISMPIATTSADGYLVQADWDSWTNHVADNTQAHSDYLLNSAADTMTGNLTITSTDPAIILDETTATDTDFWLANISDSAGDDDDTFQIGDGTTPGTNPFLSIDTSGNVGIGTTGPEWQLTVSSGAGDIGAGTKGAPQNINLWSGVTTGNPKLNFYGYDNASVATKIGWLQINNEGKFYISGPTDGLFLESGGDINLNYDAAGDVIVFGRATSGENRYLYLYGYDTGASAIKYGRVNVDAAGDLNIEAQSGEVIRFITGGGDKVTIDNSGNLGIGTTGPISLTEIQGGLTTVGSILTLGTKEPSVVANDVLGRINFYAPLDVGVDSDITAASIVAIAEDTFSDTVNATSLLFQTGASEVATTKMTLTSAGALTVTGQITGNITGALTGNADTVTNGVYTTSIDTFSELDTLVADKALINLADGGTFTGNIIANGNLSIGNAATTAGVLTLLEDTDAGTNYASLQVPALAGNTVYTLPTALGAAGEQLTDAAGDGILSWAVAGGAGATAYDDIGDPDANGSINMAGYTGTYTSATDGFPQMIISGTVADTTVANYKLTIDVTDDGDVDQDFFRIRDNNATDVKFAINQNGDTTIAGTLGVTGAITGSNLSNTNTGDNTVATSGDSATSFFGAGELELVRGGTEQALVDPGADGILLWDDSDTGTEWDFAAIGSGLSYDGTTLTGTGAATAYDDIGDPDANGSINMAGYTGTYTSASDGFPQMIISGTVADTTVANYKLTIDVTDDGDVDQDFFRIRDNNATDVKFAINQDGDTTIAGTLGVTGVLTTTNAALTTPALGTPSALVGTNISGTGASFTAGNVTTNANLTGEVTSVGNAATIADSVAVTSWNLTTPTITTSLTTDSKTISEAEIGRLDGLAGIITTDTTACTEIDGTNLTITTGTLNVDNPVVANLTGNASGSAGTVATITGLAPDTQNTYARTQYLIPYASTTTAFGEIAIGTATHVLTSNGAGAAPTFQAAAGGAVATDVIWDAAGDLVYGTGADTASRLAAGATTTILVGGGAAAPVWTTATGTGAPARAGSPTFTTQITTPIIDLTGGQIAFPASPSTSEDVNTLDDYEEGTWTPVLGGAGGTSGQAYSTQDADYVKVGSKVTVTFYLAMSTEGTITGNLELQGLPFTVKTTTYSVMAIGYPSSWTLTAAHNLAITTGSNTTKCPIYEVELVGDSPVALTAGAVENGTNLMGTLTYFTAS